MKLTYSGNYHNFNKLVKHLDNRVNIGGVSAPAETTVDSLTPSQELSNVYHSLSCLISDASAIKCQENVAIVCNSIDNYLRKYHKEAHKKIRER